MTPMTRSDHLFGPLFMQESQEALWNSEAFLAHFKAYEIALANAAARVGLVTQEQAARAVEDIADFVPDLVGIEEGVKRDGLPVPAFVGQLKAHARVASRPAIHVGGTSQDLIDTAISLILGQANVMFASQLSEVTAALQTLEGDWGDQPLMGRTRMQAALPILVRDRMETWRLPLVEGQGRLDELRKRVEILQFGGAVGDRAAVAPFGEAMAAAMAEELGLHNPDRSWHSMRAPLADYAHWLSLVTASLGKMGQDLALMAQQGIEEVQFSGGGSSSAMPHKQNPVLAETLVALARYNAAQLPLMHGALVHEQERSGAAWTVEWMTLPAMVSTCTTALHHARVLLSQVERLGR